MRLTHLTFAALICAALGCTPLTNAQSCLDTTAPLTALSQAHAYVQKRSSSYDRTGANADMRPVATDESFHLKKLVLRVYWDGESAPSVEAPMGDFFGLGLGEYFLYASAPLQVAPDKALNSWFVMPFQKHARITVSNEGQQRVDALYFNVDYRACVKPLPADTLYFHAQYRQASPNQGWSTDWKNNGDRKVNDKPNLGGDDNYVWMEA